MRAGVTVTAGVAIVLLSAVPSTAQVVERPSRPFRGLFGGGPPPDPNRTRQEVTLTASLLGGYDEVLGSSGAGTVGNLAARQSGYTGYADTELRYWRGRLGRSIEITAQGFVTGYRDVGIGPSPGGNARAQVVRTLGRSNTLTAGAGMAYEPFVAMGGFGALEGQVAADALPGAGPSHGLYERRSWRSDASVSLDRRLTRRQDIRAAYSFTRREYLDDLSGGDSRAHGAQLGYDWMFARTAGFRASFQHSDLLLHDADGMLRPVKDQSVDVGLVYDRALSRTRQLTFNVGAGATRVDTVSALTREPQEYWTPSGSAGFRADLARTWAVTVDYRRGATVLDGISLETFFSDALAVSSGGLIGSRGEVTVTGGYSRGRTAASDGEPGRYESYTATVQFRYAVARWCAAVLNYSYDDYRLRDVTGLPEGFPPRSDRNAVRVGLSFWLPLYGSYVDRPRQQSGGGS